MILLSLSVIFLLPACKRSGTKPSDEEGTEIVAVSTPALGHIIDRVSGGEIRSVVLVPEGADPETYEPDMAAMKSAAGARALLSLNSPGFEQRLTEQLSSSLPDLKTADLSAGIPRLKSSAYGNHPEGDPHLLASPANACLVVDNAVSELSRIYPDKAALFRQHGKEYKLELEEINKTVRGMVTAGSAFVVTHPSLSYFARDYGLTQLPLERDGKEATPRQLELRLQEAASSNPRAVFYEKSHSPEQARMAARKLGVMELPVDFNAADFDAQYIVVAKALTK